MMKNKCQLYVGICLAFFLVGCTNQDNSTVGARIAYKRVLSNVSDYVMHQKINEHTYYLEAGQVLPVYTDAGESVAINVDIAGVHHTFSVVSGATTPKVFGDSGATILLKADKAGWYDVYDCSTFQMKTYTHYKRLFGRGEWQYDTTVTAYPIKTMAHLDLVLVK